MTISDYIITCSKNAKRHFTAAIFHAIPTDYAVLQSHCEEIPGETKGCATGFVIFLYINHQYPESSERSNHDDHNEEEPDHRRSVKE